MNSFSQLFQEVPDFGEILMYAVVVAFMVIGVVFGRFMVRGLINRRVHGIRAEGMNFGEISTLGQKGLLTDEELKLIRRRFAERQLEETRAEKMGIKAKDLLLAIEADPSRATLLLPPSSEHAQRALEGLKAGSARSVEEQLRAQLGTSTTEGPKAGSARSVEEQLRAQLGASAPPPPPQAVPAGAPGVSAARSTPAAPRTAPEHPSPPPPRPAQPRSVAPEPAAPQSPPSARAGGAAMDLDAMLAKGLISRREYDLLMARVKKAGER